MPSTVPILVQHDQGLPRDWQRFVAVLCFMEFYVTFVYAGAFLWDDDCTIMDYSWLAHAPSWACIAMMCGALLLYVAGRGSWRGGSSAGRWVWLGLVSVCVLLALEAVLIWGWLSKPGFYAPPTPVAAGTMCIQLASSAYVAPLGALILGICLTRSSSRLHGTSTAAWVYCAAAFCLAALPKWIFSGRANMTTVGYVGWHTTGNYSYMLLAHVANVVLPLATCVALLFHWRTARSAALIVVTVVAVDQWYACYPISELVRVSIGVLRLAHGFADIGNRVWTKHDFVSLFVEPVRIIGPWLLIAIYAWKVPMSKPPEDGSPFPRRFCGNCHYNLHGAASARCPECGSEIAP